MPMTEETAKSGVLPLAGDSRPVETEFAHLHAVMATIAARLTSVHPHEAGSTIDWALKIIGQAAGVDRCSLYRVAQRGSKLVYYREWCQEGIGSSHDNLEGVSPDVAAAWINNLGSVELIHVSDTANPHHQLHPESQFLFSLEVRSALIVPIHVMGSLFGCLGFYTTSTPKHWQHETIATIKIIVELISNIFDKQRIMDQISRNENRYRAIFDGAAVGVSLADSKGRLLDCNPSLAKMLGYSRDELRAMTFSSLTHPDDRDRDLYLYQELLKGELEHYQIEKRYLTKDGRVIWLRLSVACIDGPTEASPATIRVLENITEEKNAQQLLNRYRLLAENARDIILFLDGEGHVLEANRAAIQAYGYSRDELLSLSISELRQPSARAAAASQMAKASEGVLFETIHIRKDGSSFPVEVSSKSHTSDDQQQIVSIIRDITDRKKAEAAIQYLNHHDKLTGFYNRTHFEDLMRDLDREDNLPLSVIIGDLNGLKQINVALGESFGDQLLIKTAEIIREVCGPDTLASRWGDDEYAILLPSTDETEALRLCEQIDLVCSRHQRVSVQPNLAIGTATKWDMLESLPEVCQAAEERMYRNKFLEQKSPRSYLVSSLTRTLRERNLETEEHAQRLEQIAVHMAKAMGLAHDKLDELRLLATLHDIGKVGIPDDILMKPGPLTPADWKTMKKHCEIGYRIAEATPDLIPIARAILTHHERWDGRGYPLGLKGEEIPLIARIISIIDSYDVMTHARPYKEPMGNDEAIAEIRRCAGSQFDPQLVEAFVNLYASNTVGERAGTSD